MDWTNDRSTRLMYSIPTAVSFSTSSRLRSNETGGTVEGGAGVIGGLVTIMYAVAVMRPCLARTCVSPSSRAVRIPVDDTEAMEESTDSHCNEMPGRTAPDEV